MSSYFDAANTEIRDCRDLPEEDFIACLKGIENRVVQDCLLIAGDREFPDDLRQRIVSHVALHAVGYVNISPSEDALWYAKACKCSKLIAALHEDFHDVARRKIVTRFGLLFDHPKDALNARDAQLAESGV